MEEDPRPEGTQADDELADPEEHPEQHAALGTGGQSEAAPETSEGDERIDTEQHSEEEGPFGTG